MNFGINGLPSGASAGFSPTSLSGNGTSTLTVTTTGATLPGNYPLTISGGDGASTNTTTVMLVINPLPDFSLSITPDPIFVLGGNSTNATVAVNAINTFSNTVNLRVSGATPHITAGLVPTAVAAPGTSSLTFATDSTTPDGVYPLTVTGTNSTLTHTAAVSLVVMNIQLSATPPTQAVSVGSNVSYTISIATNSNFTGTANLGVSGLPTNVTAAFAPPSLANAGSSTLTIAAGNTAVVGTYALIVTATNDSLVASVPLVLNVNTLLAAPGTLLWTAGSGAGINWSTAVNWTNTTSGGYGQPGISNDVVLGSTATVGTSNTVDNIVDTSPTINSLTFNNTNGFHTAQIAGGAALAVVGSKGITIGTESDLGNTAIVYDSITGSGALAFSNANANLLLRQTTAGSSSGAILRGVLDLSGLNSFTMNGRSIEIGTSSAGSGTARTAGTLYLAQSNRLTLTMPAQGVTTNAGIDVADSPNANSSQNSYVYLGRQNSIYVDGITVGGGRNIGWMGFNTNFANPTAFIRGTNGDGSRVSRWLSGDNSGASNTGSNSRGTNDFSGGSVDAMIDTMILGRGESPLMNSGNSTGVAIFAAGIINVNNLQLGVQAAGATGGTVTGNGGTNYAGQIDIDGTATLVVNTNLLMTVTNGGNTGAMNLTAILNVNGGTVQATNIIGGSGTSTINLNSGVIDLQGNGQISNVTTIAIGDGISSAAELINGAKIISPNVISIATNGTLAGNTIVTAPGLIVGGTISPGIAGPTPAIGSMTASAGVTFNPGGALAVAVQDANGSSGSGWDSLQAGGQLNIAATNTNPFVIRLQSFDPKGSGLVTNFSVDTSYDWTIATAGGGITNFSAADFTVDTTQFANDLEGGYFHVRTNGNSLILSFANNHPPVVSGTPAVYRTGALTVIPIAALSTNWSDPDADPVTLVTVNDSTNGASVSTDGTNIYYANPNNVADEFGYGVADIRTNPPAVYRPGDTVRSATGLVHILPAPFFGTMVETAGTLMFTGSNGMPSQGYHILSTTNLALPVSNWSLIATGAFDATGNFVFSNQVNPSVISEYFILRVP